MTVNDLLKHSLILRLKLSNCISHSI